MIPIIFIFLIGLMFGSFANVLIYRIPLNQSIIFPLSYCPHCKNSIKWYDNIPVLSYFMLKGKCRFCDQKISVIYPLVELLCATIFVILYIKFLTISSFHLFDIQLLNHLTILFFNLFFVLLVISFIDIKITQIPDVLSYYLIFTGIILALFNSVLGETVFIRLTNSLIGGIVGFITIFMLEFFGSKIFNKPAIGGGDVKLFCAIGAYLGFVAVFKIIFLASLTASLYIIILSLLKKEKLFGKYIQFAPFISIGTFVYVLLI